METKSLMSGLTGLFSRSKKVNPRHPKDPALAKLFGLSDDAFVSHDTALNISAVYRAVDILAADIGTLPVCVYRRGEGGRRELLESGSLPDLLREPNEEQTAEEFMVMLCGHLFLRGNAYADLTESGAGLVTRMMPLHPDRVRPFRAPNGEKAYEYRPKGKAPRVMMAGEVLHLTNRVMDEDGLMGLSPVDVARRSLSVAIQAETFGEGLFRNGARPGVVLSHPGKISAEAAARLKESWEERHRGARNANKTAVLEEGMTVAEVGFTPEDAQFLETRKFQVTEIARWFGLPPHKLGDLERATFSNIEEQNIDYVNTSIRTWVTKIEQRMTRSLMTPAQRRREYIKIKQSELLKGKLKERYEAYAIGRNWGWLSANDVRLEEGLNPTGSDGDVYLQPLNMVDAGQPPEPASSGRAAVIDKAAERIARKEAALIRKAIDKGVDALSVLEGHAAFVSEATGLSEQAANEYVAGLRAALGADPAHALAMIEDRKGAALAAAIEKEQTR